MRWRSSSCKREQLRREFGDLALRLRDQVRERPQRALDLTGREQGREAADEEEERRRPGHLPQDTRDRRVDGGEGHGDGGRPVRRPGAAVGDKDRHPVLVDILDDAVDRAVRAGVGEARAQGSGRGNLERPLPAPLGHDGLEAAVVDGLRPLGRHGLVAEDCV